MSVQAFLARLADTIRHYGANSAKAEEVLAEHDKEVLDAYKARVLEAALEVKDDESWCDEGFATAMRRLDITLPKREFMVGIEVTAYQTVYVKVEATDETDAVNEAEGLSAYEVMEQAEADNWNHETHDVDSNNVEVAA